MDTILTAVALFVIFSLLVFVHELGHFLAAKLAGIGVEEFALGFGKAIISKKINGTEYRFNLLPFGGYVKLEGEDREADTPKSFHNRPFIQKATVFLAGITMNVLLAIVLFGVYLVNNNYTSEIIKVTNFNFVGVEQVQEFYPIIVREVNQAGPANGKIKQGDAIVAISETRFKNVDEFRSLLASNKGKETQVSLLDLNDNSIKNVTIDLSKSQDGAIGISISLPQFGYYIVSYPKNILSAFAHTYNIGIYQFPAIAELINKSIRESDPSYAAQSVSGVVGVTAVVNQLVVSRAVLQLINLTALVSISLAIVNVLPLPVLDGGQLLIAAVESTRRRKLSDTVLNRLNFASLVFVLGLTILITFKDIWQFNVAGEIVNFVKKILSI